MTHKEKAEQYVREKLPELMELSFGCEIYNFDEPIDWARTQMIVHYDLQKSVLVAREKDGSTYRKSTTLEGYKIIGHAIQLQHYMQVLDKQAKLYQLNNAGVLFWDINQDGIAAKIMHFNLKTGQPEGEAGFKDFCEIVGI